MGLLQSFNIESIYLDSTRHSSIVLAENDPDSKEH